MARPQVLTVGVLLALTAAVAFGLTTPAIAWASRDVGPLTTAALLYAGACAMAIALRGVSARSGAGLGRAQAGRVIAVAIAGAAIAPTLLAWGLGRAGATTGSLLLNFEAVFTVLLAFALYRERIGARVAAALGLMVLGGAALTLDVVSGASWDAWGVAAVVGATLAWALDNALTRPLADHDPLDVVRAKAALGAAMTAIVAIARGETLPRPAAIAVLVACGATGYGLSLRLYLLAQRRIGAARTGSVFAIAPFLGAAVAWVGGDRSAGTFTLVSAALFAGGVWLHLTERHAHGHVHAAIDHEHAHRHDDGHHEDHRHEPPVVGEHTHRHRHERVEHEHEHGIDLHHDHEHEHADAHEDDHGHAEG